MKIDETEERVADASEDDGVLAVEIPTNIKAGLPPACQCVTCCNNHSGPPHKPVKIGAAG